MCRHFIGYYTKLPYSEGTLPRVYVSFTRGGRKPPHTRCTTVPGPIDKVKLI